MTGLATHGEHLGRHLQKLKPRFDHTRVQELLDAAGLQEGSGGVKSAAGGEIAPMHCAAYLDALRGILGDAEYYPARVNFILARCSCVNASASEPGQTR
jgi:hypothetical protein